MNLAAYTRVSTDRQVVEGFGLDTQRATITEWAKPSDRLDWHTDEGISGSNGLDLRAGLSDAIRTVGKKNEGLVVARLDRLARDLLLQEALLADVRRRGGRVYSCAAGEDAYLDDDPADPSRRFIRQVLGAVAEYDRAMIRAKLEAGKARKRAAGGYAGDGSPPYGWRALNGDLVPVPAEQTQIDVMRAMHATGASLREIGRLLESTGVPTKTGGTRWHPKVIAEILRRTDP